MASFQTPGRPPPPQRCWQGKFYLGEPWVVSEWSPLNLARQTPKLQILHETTSEKAVLVVYVQAEMMPARCLSPIPRSKTFPNTQTHSWMLRGSAAVLLASINESDLILGEPNSRPSLALPSKPGGWTTTSKSQAGYARYAHALKSRVYNKP